MGIILLLAGTVCGLFGLVTLSENVFVGGALIVSGSVFISGSFIESAIKLLIRELKAKRIDDKKLNDIHACLYNLCQCGDNLENKLDQLTVRD